MRESFGAEGTASAEKITMNRDEQASSAGILFSSAMWISKSDTSDNNAIQPEIDAANPSQVVLVNTAGDETRGPCAT